MSDRVDPQGDAFINPTFDAVNACLEADRYVLSGSVPPPCPITVTLDSTKFVVSYECDSEWSTDGSFVRMFHNIEIIWFVEE